MKLKFILILFILSNLYLYSQNSVVPQQLNLDQCYKLALKNNPEIILANSQVASNDAARTAALGTFLPSVNFIMGFNRQLNAEGAKSFNLGGQNIFINASNPNSYNMALSANYVLFNGFEREASYNKAINAEEAYFNNTNYTQQKVFFDIYSNYIEVVKNSQVINVRKESLNLAKQDLEKTKAQFNAGIIPLTMIYTQEAELGNKELDLIVAENNYKRSKANLLTVIGLNPNLNVEFDELSIPSSITLEEIRKNTKNKSNLTDLVQRALDSRGDYKALKLNLTSKQFDITIAKSNYYPRVSASGGWNWSNSEFNKFGDYGKYVFGLNLSMPIFDNFSTNYSIENAKFSVSQSQFQLFQLEQQIKNNVQNAFLNLEAAIKQIEIANRTLVASEKSYESTKERFNAGTATVSDYFLATNQQINSKINVLSAVYNYYFAEQQLNFLLGDYIKDVK